MTRSRWLPAPWAPALVLSLFVALPSAVSGQVEYQRATSGTRSVELGRISMKVLVEETNLGGGEVEIAEMVFPAGGPRTGGDHRHSRIEIFYVLSGVMGHVVNGESHELRPGMVGIVRPGDSVAHYVLSEEPVRTLVIWAPGGELERIAPRQGG